MFKLLDVIPRIQAFKVPELNLKNVNLLRDKLGIKYFSKNGTAFLEYDDSSRLVKPNESIVVIHITNNKYHIMNIFHNEEEFLEVYNVTNINIIKE